jgi:hypothetical protein
MAGAKPVIRRRRRIVEPVHPRPPRPEPRLGHPHRRYPEEPVRDHRRHHVTRTPRGPVTRIHRQPGIRQPVRRRHRAQRARIDQIDRPRRHQEQPRLVPVRPDQQRHIPASPRPESGKGRRGHHRPVHHRREWQQAQRQRPPPRRIRRRLHLHHQVGRGLHQLVQRHSSKSGPLSRNPQRRGQVPAHHPRLGHGERVRPRPALGDSLRKQPSSQRHRQQRGHAHGPGRLARHRDPRRIPPERPDIPLHPPQRGQLVEQPEVHDAVVEEQEPLGRQPVVDRYAHHAVAGERRAVVLAHRRRPVHERPAVDPDQHRQPGRTQIRRPHVQVQALLARDHHLGEQRDIRRRVIALRHRRPERRRLPLPVPPLHRPRRPHPVRPERRRRVRNPEKRGHPRHRRPAHHPVRQPHHWLPRDIAHASLRSPGLLPVSQRAPARARSGRARTVAPRPVRITENAFWPNGPWFLPLGPSISASSDTARPPKSLPIGARFPNGQAQN